MRVEFKKTRCINVKEKSSSEIKQYDFPKGIHTLPKELENHWFFKALVNCGDVVILDSSRHSGGPENKPKVRKAKKPVIYNAAGVPVTSAAAAS